MKDTHHRERSVGRGYLEGLSLGQSFGPLGALVDLQRKGFTGQTSTMNKSTLQSKFAGKACQRMRAFKGKTGNGIEARLPAQGKPKKANKTDKT